MAKFNDPASLVIDMPNPTPDRPDNTSPETDGSSPPGIPRWLKMSGIIVLVVILLVVIIQLVVGGQHGPGLHTSSGADGDSTTISLTLAHPLLARATPRHTAGG